MPNWCSSELSIQGDSEEIKRFMLANMGLPAKYAPTDWEIREGYQYPTEPRFSFNALVPTPQEVLDIGYDGHTKLQKLAAELGETAVAGLIDGYHWNIENWGTKWDIYCDDLSLEKCGWEEGCTEVTLYFDTAWSPPVAWLFQVAPMFPQLHFELHYAEPGMCFAGDIVCEGESSSIDEYDFERCQAMFGYDDEECDEEAELSDGESSVPVQAQGEEDNHGIRD